MPRKYLETHPWISFSVDTRQAEISTWLLLGEAQSKCEHIAGALLDPKTANELHSLYLAKGALATTAIEGNTLSEEQVKLHLAGKLELPESKKYLQKEVDNIIKACNSITYEHLRSEKPPLSTEEILRYNSLVLNDLPKMEDVTPGQIRQRSVTVGRYRGAPAEDCSFLLDKLCAMLEDDFSLGGAWPIASAVLKAILAHLYIAWIHPFDDGNGRTARLMEFYLLMRSGVPSIASHVLSNHYNNTRNEYYRQLQNASETGDLSAFIEYALEGFCDGLENIIKVIHKDLTELTWKDYVHDKIEKMQDEGKNPKTLRRIRQLAYYIPADRFYSNEEIKFLNKKITEEYIKLNAITLRRDLDLLVEEGLLTKEKNKYSANYRLLQNFSLNAQGRITSYK